MAIGDRIKRRREELAISQDELAKRLGYKSRSSINKIELGLQNLNQSKIKAIADALQTTPAFIMGWDQEEAPPQLDHESIEMAKIFAQLSSENRFKILELSRLYLEYQQKAGNEETTSEL